MSENLPEHWEKIYSSRPLTSLGWYEAGSAPSLRLLAHCALSPTDPILDAGAGASTFIDSLLDLGFSRVHALDISPSAFQKLQERLGPERAARVTWHIADITQPSSLAGLTGLALWHDRALLHFLTAESDRQTYRQTLLAALRPGGYVILAAFSPSGAKMCSGLPVRQYDVDAFAAFLGPSFALLHSFDYLYTNPSGEPRPYTYALFLRNSPALTPD